MPNEPPTFGVRTRTFSLATPRMCAAIAPRIPKAPCEPTWMVCRSLAASYSATAARGSIGLTTRRLFESSSLVTWAAAAKAASTLAASPKW